MPELPEVETTKKKLDQSLTGLVIKEVDVLWDNIIALPEDIDVFKNNLKGQIFEGVSRRGKYLVFQLTDYTLVSHLRMEGKYFLVNESENISDYVHVVFYLEQGKKLLYHDVRKFGKMYLVEAGQEFKLPNLMKLGPEPRPDTFKLNAFKKKLKRHRKSIKAVLLDQTAVAGLGNIYADEVLFQSEIHPSRPANSLTEDEVKSLRLAIFDVLNLATEKRGTTIRSYSAPDGEEGEYQNFLKVYGKEGLECVECGTEIEKEKIAQRGTHFCPKCQV
jgi:formamidopyrimidine-DNA glycosylase